MKGTIALFAAAFLGLALLVASGVTNSRAATASTTQLLIPIALRSTTIGGGTATSVATAVATATPTRTSIPATSTPVATSTGTPFTATTTRTATTTTGATATATMTSSGSSLLTAWIVNTAGTLGAVYTTTTVNVQSVAQVTQSSSPYAYVQSKGIPNYSTVVTSSLLSSLTSRPKASTDFRSGSAPTISVGQTVNFGQDIGYKSSGCTSSTTTGYGYWPPGPECSTAQTTAAYFPLTPVPATSSSSTAGGKIGLWVNGVSIFNWGDAQTYNNQGVWYRTAADFEIYDMDIDSGHAARGEYHHHFYPSSLAGQLGDTGTGHSPIYGFAADGYALYGPWTAANTLAVSGWKKRDYDTVGSATGCGTAKVRSCLLVDQTNISLGTTTASSNGPRTDASVSTANGNTVATVSGVYQQDYYFDSTCSTCMDKHNGHTHDGLGYHYHVTVTQPTAGTLTPYYPYTIGPTYYGQIASNSFASARSSRAGSWAPAP